MTNIRKVTCHLLDLADEGALSWETLARECLAYMSEDEAEDMARVADWLPAEEDEEDEGDS